jgi:aminoglycoside/choline kinase family phosphotransferase
MQAIKIWCEKQLAGSVQLDAMRGDAGQRRYYRLHNSKPHMLAVSAPPKTEKNAEWRAAHAWLSEAGVRVPQIYAEDTERGFWLVEDLGDALLYDTLIIADESEAGVWYERCFDVLLRIQRVGDIPATARLKKHDGKALIAEMNLFNDWFSQKLLGQSLSIAWQRAWDSLCDTMLEEFTDMPLVPEHGDYQSRNLLLGPDNTLAVIDFQDAALGSPAYDLASLLKDCYLRWEPEIVHSWMLAYMNKARTAGVLAKDEDAERFRRHFDWIGLQRHLRVLGTFSRLHLRDGKSDYLRHIPCIMRYVDQCLDRYRELQLFSDYWHTVRCLAEKQSGLQA